MNEVGMGEAAGYVKKCSSVSKDKAWAFCNLPAAAGTKEEKGVGAGRVGGTL